MISTWTGACGLMSGNASACSSSFKRLTGMTPAAILQKRQSEATDSVGIGNSARAKYVRQTWFYCLPFTGCCPVGPLVRIFRKVLWLHPRSPRIVCVTEGSAAAGSRMVVQPEFQEWPLVWYFQ